MIIFHTDATKPLLRIALFLFTTATGLVRAQDPLQTLPGNYRLVYENQYVRVIHVAYAAHERLPLHDHSDKPTVYVYLSDSGPVRFSHVEEHAFQLVRPPEKAGTFRVSPGRLEKHEVENLGDIPTEFLRVELKQVPLGFQGSSFRSSKSFDLTRSGVSREFPGPFIKIQRVVAVKHEKTEIQPSDIPELLIAFSSTLVHMDNAAPKSQSLKRGEVLWLNPYQACDIREADQTAPANLLRILFLPNG